MKEEIADRIRMARLSKSLSQQNVADELGLTVAAYSNIERGVTDITVSRLRQIAAILEKDMAELLGIDQGNMVSDHALVYDNTLSQQLVMLSQQMGVVQARLDKVEEDVRGLQK
jgi:transcriptional regulator with XRE-family HTH domain